MNIYKKSRGVLAAAVAGAALITGCGNNDDFVFTNTQAPPPALAPVAVNDTATAIGNATLNQTAANGVLSNDQLNGGQISAFDAVSTQGATVVLNDDGSFTYSPVFGFTGNDTFTYTLENGVGTSTATVTMNVPNEAFFVDNSQAVNGNGAQATPFNNLADGIAAANSGDTVFVFRGNGTNNNLTGAVILAPGVNLVGQGEGLILAQTVVPQGLAPVLTGPITAQGGNTISGIIIDGAAGNAITANTVTDLTVSNNTFRDSANRHIELVDVGGTISITGNDFGPHVNDFVEYIDLRNTNVNATLAITNNTFTDDGTVDPDDGVSIDTFGTTVLALTYNDNLVTSDDSLGSIDDALEVDAFDTSQVTVTANNNNISNLENDAIDLDTQAGGASLTATVAQNMISDCDDTAIEIDTTGGTITVSATNNVIDNMSTDGINVSVDDNGNNDNSSLTLTATANTISNCDDGVDIEGNNNVTPGTLKAALRNNTITDSGDKSVNVDCDDDTLCLDITGNTVNDDMAFDESGSGIINVERLLVGEGGPLDAPAVNTFTVPAVVPAPTGNVVSVAAGFCAIP
jgi:Bacterial Ig domain